MGALFFALLMLLLLIVAFILLLVGTISVVKSKRKSGKRILIAGLAPLLLVVFVLAFLQQGNMQVLLMTLKITHTCVDMGSTQDHFSINGKDYYLFSENAAPDVQRGEAVAFSPVYVSPLYVNYAIYYEAINNQGFDLLISNVDRSNVFCAADDFDAAKTWYSDSENYICYLEVYKSSHSDLDLVHYETYTIPAPSPALITALRESIANSVEAQSYHRRMNFKPTTHCLYSQSIDGICQEYCFDLMRFKNGSWEVLQQETREDWRIAYYGFHIPESFYNELDRLLAYSAPDS